MDYRIGKNLGARVWRGYGDSAGINLGIYQKLPNVPGTAAKALVSLKEEPDGKLVLSLNEDVLRQTGIELQTVSLGEIPDFRTEKAKDQKGV